MCKLFFRTRHTISGDNFPTDVILVKKSKLNLINEKSGWNFEWTDEFKRTIEKFLNLPFALIPILFMD